MPQDPETPDPETKAGGLHHLIERIGVIAGRAIFADQADKATTAVDEPEEPGEDDAAP